MIPATHTESLKGRIYARQALRIVRQQVLLHEAAHGLNAARGIRDAVAAQVLLQDYMDSNR